jgi:hypothetical protein
MDDFDNLVASLTPREDNPEIKLYQNTTAVACPICDDSFDSLVVCKEQSTSLRQTELLDICVSVHDDRPVLFTHKS